MNKTLIFLALCLTIASSKSFFRPEQYQGSVRECAQCIEQAIPLAQQIRDDFDARNITALINDGAAAYALYERASTDCDFSKEDLQFNLAKCLSEIRTLLPLIKQTQADFDNRNLTALIDDGVALYELVNKINEDCSAEARAIFEEEAILKAAEDIEIVNPVKCVRHALNFTSELKQFVRDERNHSLTPEQTFNEIWVLINQVPEVFTDCGLPVPAFFNNTKALQNCTVALYDFYEDIVKIDNDINNKDIARVLEDIESIFTAANEIRTYCRVSNFNDDEEEQQLQEVGGFAECVQAIETLVADVTALENDNKNNVTLVVEAVEAVWFALEDTLNHCGEEEITNLIEEFVSDDCVVDVGDLVDKAYEIYELRDEAFTHWRKIADDVIEFVHDLQKVQDECKRHNTTNTLEAFHFEDYQFNITVCLEQSEVVAADLDTLIADIQEARSQTIPTPSEIEAITKASFNLVDNILYDFIPACAGQAAEDDIEKFLPEACLEAIENVTLLVEDIAEHDKEIRYVISALPQLFDDFSALNKNCNTVALFMKPFYRAVDNVITN